MLVLKSAFTNDHYHINPVQVLYYVTGVTGSVAFTRLELGGGRVPLLVEETADRIDSMMRELRNT